MRVMRTSLVVAISGLVACLPDWAVHAAAQQPSSTTATYGSWVVRCNTVDKARVCEIVQSLAAKNKLTVAQIAIGHLPGSKAVRAVLQVPVGVDLTKPASLVFGEKDTHAGRYVICTTRYCRAEMDLPAAATGQFEKLKKAVVRFHMGGKTVMVPMDVNGMSAAFKVATKETKR